MSITLGGGMDTLVLSSFQQKELIRIARLVLEYHVSQNSLPKFKITDPALVEKKGVFVTLSIRDKLRGCIGFIEAQRPLYESVMDCAAAAASEDPRFPPVTNRELPEIEIEISVLSMPKKIADWKEIVIGRDGIILSKKGLDAVFLPQVAVEQKWDLQETLRHLSQKAGLGPDDWKQGAEFRTFTAQVFGENE